MKGSGKGREGFFSRMIAWWTIGNLRVMVQIIMFILLIYGGYFISAQHIDSAIMPFVRPPAQSVKMPHLDPPTAYDEVFDTYFPSRTCRYIDSEPRVFRACSMHFFTEVPVYGVPLKDFLPHLFVFLVLAFLFSRLLCGWLCPLGALQDFLAWTRRKLGLTHLQLPRAFLNFFEKFRYVWLIFLFLMGVAIILPFMAPSQQELNVLTCSTCPGRIMFPLLTGSASGWWVFSSPIQVVISVVAILFFSIFVLSFFGKRLWCKLCPTGALLSLFNKGGAVIKEKDARKCTKCGICERVCPMDNKKVFEEKKKRIVNAHNCINCFKCVEKCPEDDCLRVKWFRWRIFRSEYREEHAKKDKASRGQGKR